MSFRQFPSCLPLNSPFPLNLPLPLNSSLLYNSFLPTRFLIPWIALRSKTSDSLLGRWIAWLHMQYCIFSWNECWRFCGWRALTRTGKTFLRLSQRQFFLRSDMKHASLYPLSPISIPLIARYVRSYEAKLCKSPELIIRSVSMLNNLQPSIIAYINSSTPSLLTFVA